MHKRLKCSKMHLVSSPEICPSVKRNYSGYESVNTAGAIDMVGYSVSSHFLPSLLDKSQVRSRLRDMIGGDSPPPSPGTGQVSQLGQ